MCREAHSSGVKLVVWTAEEPAGNGQRGDASALCCADACEGVSDPAAALYE